MPLVDRYCRADAVGGGDGTTDTASGANGAWTLAEALINRVAGMRLNVAPGSYGAFALEILELPPSESPPGGAAPFNVITPNNAPDLLSVPDPSHGYRDWWVLEAIRDRLQETRQFDDVCLSGLPDQHGRNAGELKVAVLEPNDWEELDESDDPADVQDTVRMRFKLTLIVRQEDPELRDREVDRLVNVCKNVIDGQPIVPLQVLPGWTKLRRGKWEPSKGIERRQTITGETAYFVDGETEHDETE